MIPSLNPLVIRLNGNTLCPFTSARAWEEITTVLAAWFHLHTLYPRKLATIKISNRQQWRMILAEKLLYNWENRKNCFKSMVKRLSFIYFVIRSSCTVFSTLSFPIQSNKNYRYILFNRNENICLYIVYYKWVNIFFCFWKLRTNKNKNCQETSNIRFIVCVYLLYHYFKRFQVLINICIIKEAFSYYNHYIFLLFSGLLILILFYDSQI